MSEAEITIMSHVELRENFTAEMKGLLDEGVVNLPAPALLKNAGPDDTTTVGVMMTLTNALKLRREGAFESIDIH